MTADVRAAVEQMVNEAGGYPPTRAEREAIPDPSAVVDAALKRMARLEKVAELARDGISGLESGDLDFEGFVDQLQAALAELDAEEAP
jgi:hypothetical protein